MTQGAAADSLATDRQGVPHMSGAGAGAGASAGAGAGASASAGASAGAGIPSPGQRLAIAMDTFIVVPVGELGWTGQAADEKHVQQNLVRAVDPKANLRWRDTASSFRSVVSYACCLPWTFAVEH